MATNFPGKLDVFNIKRNNIERVMAEHVNDLQDAVMALQRSVGTRTGEGSPLEDRITTVINEYGTVIDPRIPNFMYNSTDSVSKGTLLTVDTTSPDSVKKSTGRRDLQLAGVCNIDIPSSLTARQIEVTRGPVTDVLVESPINAVSIGDYLIIGDNTQGYANIGARTNPTAFAIALENKPALSSPFLIKALITIGGAGGGAGGEWIEEEDGSTATFSSVDLINNTYTLALEDTDEVKGYIYSLGRFISIDLRLEGSGVERTVLAQIKEINTVSGVTSLVINNVQDIDGETTTIDIDDSDILKISYATLQAKYLGTSNDVNSLNKSILDHVQDGSIHTTFDQIYKVQDLSSQVASISGYVADRILNHNATSDATICVFRNGLLLTPVIDPEDPSDEGEYEILNNAQIKIRIPVWDYENITVSYIAFGKFHTIKFNDKLVCISGKTEFVTTFPFNSESLQVFRNGQLLKEGLNSNDYQISNSNSFVLNTAIIDEDETIICHYDKTRNQFPRSYSILVPGIAEVGENKGLKAFATNSGTIIKVYVASDTSPDSDLRLDIKKCGPLDNGVYTSIFENDAKKPVISAGEYKTQVTDIENALVVEGTRLRLDIETTGSSSAPGGDDLIVSISVEE